MWWSIAFILFCCKFEFTLLLKLESYLRKNNRFECLLNVWWFSTRENFSFWQRSSIVSCPVFWSSGFRSSFHLPNECFQSFLSVCSLFHRWSKWPPNWLIFQMFYQPLSGPCWQLISSLESVCSIMIDNKSQAVVLHWNVARIILTFVCNCVVLTGMRTRNSAILQISVPGTDWRSWFRSSFPSKEQFSFWLWKNRLRTHSRFLISSWNMYPVC